MQGLIGKKLGMTQVFDGEGRRVAVTVIEAGPCRVLQRKTRERDGYDAVQLGYGVQKEHRLGRARVARCKKAGSDPLSHVREFRLDADEDAAEGDAVTVQTLEGASHVDVTGVSKGRGFQGVVKRFRMRGGPASHGGHSVRRVGAIGQCAYPARVAKGRRLPGHMGHVRVTTQNLQVVDVRGDENLLLVKGAVAGPNGGLVVIRKALKKAGKS